MVEWLNNAVFYEIYPQSFYDSNGDGIGDIRGIIEKLDYIKNLGANAIWLNPIYDSPFKDAGYDVRNYKKVAARYGTNDDVKELFDKAHEKGIRVILDLVCAHTSDEHEWFLESKKPEQNKYSKRYVWTNGAFEIIENRPYISGASDRDGVYLLNFFSSQPALNYGFYDRNKTWMSDVDSAEVKETIEAIKDVMKFWLDMGADGFRCDMADSLVKNDDENKTYTAKVWRKYREFLDENYPEAVLVSEWSNPDQAINGGGFHMDFYLNHYNNGYHTLLRDYEVDENDNSYFRKNGRGNISRFLKDYLPKYNKTKENGYISMFTCNHDTPRPSRTLTHDELKIAYAFILTMPGVPFIYYGDEVGIKYRENMISKEGGYHRTGSRTPMQWSKGKNRGFSNAKREDLYLPVEEFDGNDVETQEKEKNSLLNTTKELIHLRKKYEDLQAHKSFEIVYQDDESPLFMYKRGEMILAINPSNKKIKKEISSLKDYNIIYKIGNGDLAEDVITIDESSFIALKKK